MTKNKTIKTMIPMEIYSKLLEEKEKGFTATDIINNLIHDAITRGITDTPIKKKNNTSIGIRVDDFTFNQFKQLVESKGYTISGYIRFLLTSYYDNK